MLEQYLRGEASEGSCILAGARQQGTAPDETAAIPIGVHPTWNGRSLSPVGARKRRVGRHALHEVEHGRHGRDDATEIPARDKSEWSCEPADQAETSIVDKLQAIDFAGKGSTQH